MFCVHMTLSYDSTDDVLCKHDIIIWHHWWCFAHTWHHHMIPLMMFCAHMTSSYDSTDDVLCTHGIIIWFHWWCFVHTWHHHMIPLMMFFAHMTSSYDSTDDVLCTYGIIIWFHWWCFVHTWHHHMIPLMMHVSCTRSHRHMIPLMIFCAGIDSTGFMTRNSKQIDCKHSHVVSSLWTGDVKHGFFSYLDIGILSLKIFLVRVNVNQKL